VLSLNDVVTAAIALAAVAVPLVALYIGAAASRRAARSSLTELTLRIGEKAAKFDADAPTAFALYTDIWVMAREADDIRTQLRNKFPESVGVKIAQALELGNDWTYADRYWELASQTADPMFRARTMSFWALALFTRGDQERGRSMTKAAVEGLTLTSVDAAVFRGDTYRYMGERDPEHALRWFTMAKERFEAIPASDGRLQWGFGWLLGSVRTVIEAKKAAVDGAETPPEEVTAAAAAIPPLQAFAQTVEDASRAAAAAFAAAGPGGP
jgi:hypothetical protein